MAVESQNWRELMGVLLLRLLKFFALFCGSLALLALVAITTLWLYVAAQLPTVESIVLRPVPACPVAVENQAVELAKLPPYLTDAFIVEKAPEFRSLSLPPTLQMLSSITGALLHLPIASFPPPDAFSKRLARNSVREATGKVRGVWSQLKILVQADRIEMTLSKNTIFELALAQMYFGDKIVGLQCASKYYFAKTAPELTLAESALFAAVSRNPSSYDPVRSPDMAISVRNGMIGKLLRLKLISGSDARQATESPLLIVPRK
jgi:penicillin-binding protein 1A